MSPPRPTTPHLTPLTAIATRLGAPAPEGGSRVEVSGVTLDSRTVRPGDLYAALPGFHTHGAQFAATAVAGGAVAVLTDPQGRSILREVGPGLPPAPVLVVDAPRAVLGLVAAQVYGEPGRTLHLLGITGTNGKTTTAYLVDSALRAAGVRTGLIGTVETRIGDERLASVRTTPESTDLHALLALMRERGVTTVVMEVSSHALAQHRVDGAVYDVAVFTNLSQDHLDFHGTMGGYFDAKARLFTPEHARRGVVCVDDEWGRRLAGQAGIPVVTVASRRGVDADWTLRPGQWPDFTLEGPRGSLRLHCHLPGAFNIVNTALAAVTLSEGGHDLPAIAAALESEPRVPGRMERVTGSGDEADAGPRCIVDYAHTPRAVEAALQALRPTTAGRLVVVLGAGGDRDRGKRPGMGAAAARHADVVIVTDDNPRSEDPQAIRQAVLAGARGERQPRDRPPPTLLDVEGRSTAIEAAVAAADGPDDTVVVLGKGHETGQEICGVTHHFDDREALRAALAGTTYRPETLR